MSDDDYIPFEGPFRRKRRMPMTAAEMEEDIARAKRSLAKIKARKAKRKVEEIEADRQKLLGKLWEQG